MATGGSFHGGVCRFDGAHFTFFTTQDGLAHNRLHALLEDRRGQLWFATDAGVSCYDGRRFKTFTTADGLAHNWVGAMLEDRQGQLWMGSGKVWEEVGAA